MRTRQNGSTTASAAVPANAFTEEYLELLSQRDEPVTAAEADTAGPWHLEACPPPQNGWAVLRQGESLEKGSTPTAIFQKRDAARLAAAVLPGTGRRLRYRLGKDAETQGYPLLDDGRVVGHLRFFDEDLVGALNVVDALVSMPRDLAWLIDGAGGLALDHAGKIALERALDAEAS
ncbi:MAG TPA: hypothetical protein VEW48_03075 [Thermoanaerobaculia bacterium]|nr:hypothetical protein [Thermoanaerobaculia bacterium]